MTHKKKILIISISSSLAGARQQEKTDRKGIASKSKIPPFDGGIYKRL